MFDRFTDRARKIMGLAREEAERLDHPLIGDEHVLFGLVQEGTGVAAVVLKSLGCDAKKIRKEIERLAPPGRSTAPTGQLPFTPRTKRVLEFALKESAGLGHAYIGTEHLLLGLLCVDDGGAAKILTALNVQPQNVRRDILDFLGKVPPPIPPPDPHAILGLGPIPTRSEAAPFTPQAQAALDAAVRLVRVRPDAPITTDMLLAGLIAEGGGAAARILAKFGVTAEIVRTEAAILRHVEPD